MMEVTILADQKTAISAAGDTYDINGLMLKRKKQNGKHFIELRKPWKKSWMIMKI